MPPNGTELPLCHLRCIAPDPQGNGTVKEEAPTQIIAIKQHDILYQNACE